MFFCYCALIIPGFHCKNKSLVWWSISSIKVSLQNQFFNQVLLSNAFDKTSVGGNLSLCVAAFSSALAVFWCEIPRAPYMVKAKRECEAQGSVICYRSQRLQQESKALSGWVTPPEHWNVDIMAKYQRKQTRKGSQNELRSLQNNIQIERRVGKS